MAAPNSSASRSFFTLLPKVYEAMGKLLMLSPQRDVHKAEQAKLEAERKAEQEKLEAERRNTLATKADIMAVKADIEKVRAELLKWQIGIGIALVTIMAKGFGWLGF